MFDERRPAQQSERLRTRERTERILPAVPAAEREELTPGSGDPTWRTRDKFEGAISAALATLGQSVINAKASPYLAVGDNVADDTAAIQAAIDAAAALPNGGTVFLPPGIYRTTGTIRMRPRVTLEGPGNQRTEQYNLSVPLGEIGQGSGGSATIAPDSSLPTFDTILFYGPDSEETPTKGSGYTFLNGEDAEMFPFYATLRGLCVYGSFGATGGRKHAVKMWRSAFVTIDRCTIQRSRGNTLYAYGCLGLRVFHSTLINYHGRNAFVYGVSDGAFVGNNLEGGYGYTLWCNGNHNLFSANFFANPYEDILRGTLSGQTQALTVFSASASTDRITGTKVTGPIGTLTVGDPVFFHAGTGTLPSPLLENKAYFVSWCDNTTGQFKVSTRITRTPSGTAGALEGDVVDLTTDGTAGWYCTEGGECSLLLYNVRGNAFSSCRFDFSVLDGVRVVDSAYVCMQSCEYVSIGGMQAIGGIVRSQPYAALHIIGATSDSLLSGTINCSNSGTGRYGVWIEGTAGYRNWCNHRYDNCGTNVVNTAFATSHTVDWASQGDTITWTSPATVGAAWTFTSTPNFIPATAGNGSAVFKSQEATETVGFYAAGSSAGLSNRLVFYRSRGTLGSPTAVQAGDTLVSLLGSAFDGSTYQTAIGEVAINAENAVSGSTKGSSVTLRATDIGSGGSRRTFLYGLSRGVAISDTAAGYPNNSAVLDLASTSRGLLLPRLTNTQRDAMTSVPDGIVLLNTTLGKFQGRVSGAWVDLH
jgi:hypothetical protein